MILIILGLGTYLFYYKYYEPNHKEEVKIVKKEKIKLNKIKENEKIVYDTYKYDNRNKSEYAESTDISRIPAINLNFEKYGIAI